MILDSGKSNFTVPKESPRGIATGVASKRSSPNNSVGTGRPEGVEAPSLETLEVKSEQPDVAGAVPAARTGAGGAGPGVPSTPALPGSSARGLCQGKQPDSWPCRTQTLSHRQILASSIRTEGSKEAPTPGSPVLAGPRRWAPQRGHPRTLLASAALLRREPLPPVSPSSVPPYCSGSGSPGGADPHQAEPEGTSRKVAGPRHRHGGSSG